jgi:hypothetical protein
MFVRELRDIESLHRINGVKTKMGVGLGSRCLRLRLCPSPFVLLDVENGLAYKFSQRWVKSGWV